MGESLRRCDLQMGCNHTETHSFHMGRTWVPARSRFGEEVGRDGPISPLIPRMNEARPFSQEPPLRIARQGCPSLFRQLWQWCCSGPNCVCFPCFPPQGPLTLTEALDCCSATALPMAQQFLFPHCAALPLSVPKPSLSLSSLSQQPDRHNHENTKRSFTALSCFLPKGRE